MRRISNHIGRALFAGLPAALLLFGGCGPGSIDEMCADIATQQCAECYACGPDGAAFSPTHTRKGGKLYRYYVSQTVLKHGAGRIGVRR